MFIGLFIGALAVGLIIGGYVGARLESRVFEMMAYSKPEVDTAYNAAQEANWLAELRLGETNSAIQDMEILPEARLSLQYMIGWCLRIGNRSRCR